jgi:hypothetical protein
VQGPQDVGVTPQESGDQARQQHDDDRVHDDEDEHWVESTAVAGSDWFSVSEQAIGAVLVRCHPGLLGAADEARVFPSTDTSTDSLSAT